MSALPPTKRVLILDDEKSIVSLCSRVIQALGAQTDTAGLVAEAEGLIRAGRYDLFVSDMRLPDGTGLDLEGLFRERNPLGRVIVITGSLMPEQLERVSARKEIVFLSKPFELDDFRGAVIGMLGASAVSEDAA
jgi:two-component system response regulator PilR (NtrC family)